MQFTTSIINSIYSVSYSNIFIQSNLYVFFTFVYLWQLHRGNGKVHTGILNLLNLKYLTHLSQIWFESTY